MDRFSLPVAAGLLTAWGAAVLVATLLATAQGALTPLGSVAGLLSGALAGALAARSALRRPGAWSRAPAGWGDFAAAAVFGTVAARQFLALHSVRDGEVLTQNPLNYGDLPLHVTYLRFFANGAPFWPENPVFTGARLQYPIGVDLWNAMLLQVGIPMGPGLVATGLLASLLGGYALWRWGGSLALLAFLFSGGIETSATELSWKNLFLALFVTQRGFLFALPAGLLLLESWRERLLHGRPGRLPVWVEGTLWGVMPLLHLHTFVFLSVLVAVWALASGRVRAALPAFVVAVLPATLGVVLVTDAFRASSMLGWAPGWMMGEADPAVFLALNFTLYPALLVLAGVLAWRGRDRPAILLLAPACLFWVGLFFVRLAPWAWDNTKVMLWCYVVTLPAIGTALGRLPAWAGRATAALWLLPGLATVADATASRRHGYVIYDAREVEAVCAALEALPITARIAVAPTFNHPVALCGHPLVAGYGGHLWSYGIDPRRVVPRLENLMEGGEAWAEAAAEIRAAYVFWGPRERQQWPRSRRPWAAAAPVAAGSWGALYALPSAK